MNIVITGHTRGIGKQFYDLATSHGHNVVGLSRSNGYDIAEIDIREHLIEADVFVNNAYVHDHQTRLLMDALEFWSHDKNKIVINLNSKMALLPLSDNHLNDFSKEYIRNKKEQTDVISTLIVAGGVKACNLVVGLVDTDMSKGVFEAPVKLDPADVALTIYNIINTSQTVHIQSMVIDAPGLNWKDINSDK